MEDWDGNSAPRNRHDRPGRYGTQYIAENGFVQIAQPRSEPSMTSANPCILTINGGSSSIKFAVYQAGEPLKQGLHGTVDRIGLSGPNLTYDNPATNQRFSRNLNASDHQSAAKFLMTWLDEQTGFESVRAVGH